jgi:hypothetical protein
MELTQGSETSANYNYNMMPGKYPKEHIQYSKHGESLKSTIQSKCSKIPPTTSMHFSTHFATVRVALLRLSWRSCFMRTALFIMRVTNSSLLFTFSLQTLLSIHPPRQKSKGVRSRDAKFKQLYLHTHWKLDTCLYELIYSEKFHTTTS